MNPNQNNDPYDMSTYGPAYDEQMATGTPVQPMPEQIPQPQSQNVEPAPAVSVTADEAIEPDTSINVNDSDAAEFDNSPNEDNTVHSETENDRTVDVEKILDEYQKSDDTETINADKRTISVPLSKIEDMDAYANRIVAEKPAEALMQLNDGASDLTAVLDAEREYTNARDQQLDALKRVKPEVLKRSIGGVGDTKATVKSRFKETNTLEVSGEDGQIVFAAMLSGGMRRIPLWNSGITITLRPLTLDQLRRYSLEVTTRDNEYGRTFGAFYYMYANYEISSYIIERLLPIAICGSNYVHWNTGSKEALLKVISIQDYPTILWAMGVMMHPNGVPINFVCAEPGCGHVSREKADISKLRLLNTEVINDQMIEHFKSNKKVNDEDLAKYRSYLPFNRKLILDTGEEGTPEFRRWTFHLKEPSLFDWRAVGRDFVGELRKTADVTVQDEVNDYLFYNYLRAYKPWIEKIELSSYMNDQLKTAIVTNDGDPRNNATIYACLNDLRMTARAEVDKMFQDYIQDTQISHICFYYPKCPKCGKEPAVSYHGYIPYDPERAFFTLALMKLLRGASISETRKE